MTICSFGHGKAESIAAFVIGLIIAAAGYEMVRAILGGAEMVPGALALGVAAGSIAIKATLYRISRREREGVARQLIQQQARRFVSSEGLRITRLGRDLCADFTLVLPQAESMEEAYALGADLEREIKAHFPDMEIIIRLRTACREIMPTSGPRPENQARSLSRAPIA